MRLLTFTGPPGIGKTRLALEVAMNLAGDFHHGAVFIDLAPLRDASALMSAIASALNLREAPGQPLAKRLKEHLRGRQTLLVLDNFEHILDAASDVASMLEASPTIKLIVTSRAPLHLKWEHRFPVPPLGLPDLIQSPGLAAVQRSPAVRLFVARARSVRPDFALTQRNVLTVAELCIGLDGLPLAIELAAARINVMLPDVMQGQLGNRLALLTGGARDVPHRHRTLRAAFDWSHSLLDDGERRLFRRLSIFVGGFTGEAAVAVCADEADSDALVVQRLHSLTEKSMLREGTSRHGSPRFTMLETLKEYAEEKARDAGEWDMLRRRHRDWFLALATQAERESQTPSALGWLDRLDDDYGNLRAVLEWSLSDGDSAMGLRLAGALGRYWRIRSRLGEGRKWLDQALARAVASMTAEEANATRWAGLLAMDQGDYAVAEALSEKSLAIWRRLGDKNRIAGVLGTLGFLAWHQGRYVAARAYSEQSLALHKERGDEQGIADMLHSLGNIAWQQGDFEIARAHYECSLALHRKLGNTQGAGFALLGLGTVVKCQGDLALARSSFEDALELFRGLGNRKSAAIALNNLGATFLAQGDDTTARAMHVEALNIRQELGDRLGISFSLHDLGEAAAARGDLTTARALFDESLALRRELNDKWAMANTLSSLGYLAIRQDDLENASSSLRESVLVRREIGDKAGIAHSLEGFAAIAVRRKDPERAAKLLGAAEALRQSTGAALSPIYGRAHEQTGAGARGMLSRRALDGARSEGRAMSLEQAVDYGLETPEVAGDQEQPVRRQGKYTADPLTVRLLGGFEVRRGSAVLPSTAWGRKRNRLLFLYLLIVGEAVSRETVLGNLWPRLDAPSAAASLRVAWSTLKRALEPGLPAGQPSAYLYADEGSLGVRWSLITTDVLDFERMMARAVHLAGIDEQISVLESAVALYRGDLLPGDANEPWTVVERERLRQMLMTALQRLGEGKESLGRTDEAAETVRVILRLEPWREEAYRWLMRLLVRLGRRSEALHVYRQCKELLRDELGVAPTPETTSLFEAISASRGL